METTTCKCKWCGGSFESTFKDDMCEDCQNAYAEDTAQLPEGWDEIGHPAYNPDLLPTRWKQA